jgi:hypothetical protein
MKLFGLSSVLGRRRVERLKERIRQRVRTMAEARARRAASVRGEIIRDLDGDRREG